MENKKESIIFYEGNFDYLGEQLECPVCGEIENDPVKADLQIKVSMGSETRIIRIGDILKGYPDPHGIGYYQFSNKYDPSSFSFIEAWDCQKCDTMRWVYCETNANHLVKVKTVILNEELLKKTDLVTDFVQDVVPPHILEERKIELWRMDKIDPAEFIKLVAEFEAKR